MVKAIRCPWGEGDPLYTRYHDREWGVPCRDRAELFELLVLEGMQAGLSWLTVLKKRRHMRAVLFDFDPERLASLTAVDLEAWLGDPGIIRHRGKLEALRDNARGFLALEDAGGAVDYFWSWVDTAPVLNRWHAPGQVPATTDVATRMSRDLKKRGFRFVGPTICYAFMQSAGLVNDHLLDCFRREQCMAPNVRRQIVD